MQSVSTMTRALALVCLAAPLWTPGVPAQEAENPRDIAVTLSAPAVYVPGMEMELTVRITAGVAVEPEGENPGDPVLALGLQVGIPDEWAYASWGELVSGTDPAIKPQAGATGALDFAWIMSAEAFPHEFRFTVLAAADASGPMTFSARALYRLSGPEFQSDIFTLAVPDEDTAPPIITLIGGDIVAIEAGKPYVEPGYVALDDVDGDISDWVAVDGAVNTTVTGDYLLTYTVADSAGNEALPVTRLVQVVPAGVTAKGFFLCGAAGNGPSGGDALALGLVALALALAAWLRHVRVPCGTIMKRQFPPQAWKDDGK